MGCTSSKDKAFAPSSGFRPIPDRFNSIEQVQAAVRAAGLESSNLILGVDFTKSNSWTGRESFDGRSLHDLDAGVPNPYQQVISVMGKTLEEFDDDRLIPAFGFGDSTTGDKACFAFNAGGAECVGFEQVLQRYDTIARSVRLAGPTCFAPVIHEAIRIVAEEKSYHILVIIADGQVTDPSPHGATARAIVEASKYPLSIIVVGVGDGPWGVMEEFDDELTDRKFDNLQFVELNTITRRYANDSNKFEAQFALAALMEIPDQYHIIKHSGLLSAQHTKPATKAAMQQLQSAPPPNYTVTVDAQRWSVPEPMA